MKRSMRSNTVERDSNSKIHDEQNVSRIFNLRHHFYACECVCVIFFDRVLEHTYKYVTIQCHYFFFFSDS